MININSYILEKLRIDKNIEVKNNIDEINDKFISDIKKYVSNKYPILFNHRDEYIEAGKSKRYIFLSVQKQYRWIYKSVAKWIEENLDIEKPCKTNNMILYIYPKY